MTATRKTISSQTRHVIEKYVIGTRILIYLPVWPFNILLVNLSLGDNINITNRKYNMLIFFKPKIIDRFINSNKISIIIITVS